MEIKNPLEHSKISKEIFKKLSLIETDRTINDSFCYDLKIYEIPNKYKTYIFECDENGKPNHQNLFLIRKERIVNNLKQISHLKVSNEFLKQLDIDTIINFINEDFEK